MVLYTCSMAVGVVLDMWVTGLVAFKMMVNSGAHTYGGKLVKDLGSMQEILNSFPMQKAVGLGLWQYCWPSTFLVGYVGECALMIFPYHFQKLILRSYKGIRGLQAERTMASWMIMDTGRYADVLVNLILACLMFFAPGGYYSMTFITMFGSHVYIYLYDQYRILRAAPGFDYSSQTIDKCAQRMLAVPLGIVLSALIWKINERTCNDSTSSAWCLGADLLMMCCLDVFAFHVCIHWVCLGVLVPRCGKEVKRSDLTYDQLATIIPATWFSTNPVHCLRSKCFYNESPPCSYYVRGKEHLMQSNPKANSHFTDQKAESEW
uniref:Uncharacterized protein n=1 Tax=Alexandrium andersonii TaxID=327968 RepID=A0A7S2BI89_9DINO|mmetsp:Transcript_26121/g.59395  ORF Transcript_26121/g.59395 Transcript_26121/m.59395 type:complete len:320 (+) Transcript_26121:1-960(+)